jgi:K+-transporting ATPase ATPase C chain
MARELKAAVLAIVISTLVLGVAYPLVVTGVSQVIFRDKADGSRLEVNGETVGSSLIGQNFRDDPAYFQSRPSVTGYAADATAFSNLGPNSRRLKRQIERRIDAYLELEGAYSAQLDAADIPVDAVTASASSVDPHISEANAEIQAHRVAEVRGLDLTRVAELIDENTDGRFLGALGEPGVNVLELNLALDDLAPAASTAKQADR